MHIENPPRRCVILSGSPDCTFFPPLRRNDYVIACDYGLHHAHRAGVVPDLLVGDFDSFHDVPDENVPTLRVKAEKDDTDTGLAVQQGLSMGLRDFYILGALGGRLDHQLANLHTAASIALQGGRCVLESADTVVYTVYNDTLTIPRREGWALSVFAWGGDARGVDLADVKYPLDNWTMTPDYPLGVSNEFAAASATVRVREGLLLVVLSDRSHEK